mmetsp:Transcript_112997/g.196166  ORF Transcript_112997/g.196166 Transcript_112997/m.196166 type:complete len:85 (+) Transcript_112997:208-462(+)
MASNNKQPTTVITTAPNSSEYVTAQVPSLTHKGRTCAPPDSQMAIRLSVHSSKTKALHTRGCGLSHYIEAVPAHPNTTMNPLTY